MNLRPFVCSVLASAFLLPMHAMGESEARDPQGRTPLMKLVGREDATVQQVQQLLDAGADINARDNTGNTVLMRACRVWWYCHEVPGDMDVVRFLVEKGVDVHARNAAGQNALEVAMCSHESDEEVLAYLRELGLTHQLGAELAMAAGQDCPDDVKRLLAAGADPNFANAAALHLSLSVGTYGLRHENEMVRMLLEAGANPNLCAEEILRCAAHGASDNAIRQILANGVDFSGIEVDKSSEWMATVWWNRETDRLPLFDLLLKSGAHVNGNTGYDAPPIIQVVQDLEQGEKELRYLLSIGCNPLQKDKHGKTALEYARELNRTELIPILENALNK